MLSVENSNFTNTNISEYWADGVRLGKMRQNVALIGVFRIFSYIYRRGTVISFDSPIVSKMRLKAVASRKRIMPHKGS